MDDMSERMPFKHAIFEKEFLLFLNEKNKNEKQI